MTPTLTTPASHHILLAFVATFFISYFAEPLYAQSAYFSVPTAEVMTEREGYLGADLDVHFDRLRNGGWQSYGLSGIYGVRKDTEIGINAYVVRTEKGLEPVELQPNFKYRAYVNETAGVSISLGSIAYIPIKKRFSRETMASVYAVAGKKFSGPWSPRLTGGAYQLVGAKQDSGSKRGLLLAVEQPVHSRVVFIADWNSGKNRFGYAAAGVGITLTNRSYLYSAYYFGNQGRGNNSLGVYYGLSF